MPEIRPPLLASAALLALALAACKPVQSSPAPAPAPLVPEVSVVAVRPQAIPVVRDLPGRVAPTRIAEVRARVAGLVVKRSFKQGTQVAEGDVLYQIDPAPFQVELESAQANVARSEAALMLARQQARRATALLQGQAASQAQHENAVAAEKQAEAALAGDKAALRRARLNLDYTTVRAPISGRIGRALVTEGALVEQGAVSNLATIQQLDPVYVDITQSVGELNRLRRDLASGELSHVPPDAANVRLLMEDGTFYNQSGRLLFSDVTADPSTGQVTLRVTIPNPQGELFPGMYVRARIQQGIDADAMAVPQQAIHRSNDGVPEVYVVGADDKVVLQPVELGDVSEGSWIVRSGLRAGDRVVVEGFQKLVVGEKVKPVDWETRTAGLPEAPPEPSAPADAPSIGEVH